MGVFLERMIFKRFSLYLSRINDYGNHSLSFFLQHPILRKLGIMDYCQLRRICTLEPESILSKEEIDNYIEQLNNASVKYKCETLPKDSCMALLQDLRKSENDLSSLEKLPPEEDDEMKELTAAERERYRNKIKQIRKELLLRAMPESEENTEKVIVHISPGVGGSESKIFSEELFNMYVNYIKYKGWNITSLNQNHADGKGIHNGYIEACGKFIFKHLQGEAGLHRVQRVPETEKSGRPHTSICKISVIPNKDINVTINPSDLKIQTIRSSGPGGQNVQKNDTCVRIHHLPTGIIVVDQQTPSQIANKKSALLRLQKKLLDLELKKFMNQSVSLRRDQCHTGERSDKIRTYNFLQNRITDHRLNHTTYNILEYMKGNQELDEMISLVINAHDNQLLVYNIRKIIKDQNFDDLFLINKSRRR